MVLFKYKHQYDVSNIVGQFTFHYGPIQIRSGREKRTQESYIYIPLWSYSNEGVWQSLMQFIKFTFHYGPIQIKAEQ